MGKEIKKSITFRLDNKNLESLEKIADSQSITLNSLVNKVIQDHVNWHALSAQSGLISFPKGLVKKLIADKSEPQIEKIAKQVVEKDMEDIMLLMRGRFTVDTFINIVETWAKVSHMSFNHDQNDGRHEIVLKHDLGPKWSVYLSKFYQIIFDNLEAKCDAKSTSNSVVLEIDSKPNPY